MTLRETYARDICQNPGVPLEDCPRQDEHYALVDERLAGFPDVLDGARAEYNECKEVRRLLGYLWTATGKSGDDPVYSLFDADDPIVADVERLAIVAALEDRT